MLVYVNDSTIEMELAHFKAALVDAIIPEDTEADLAQLIGQGSESHEGSGGILSIKERDILLFGKFSRISIRIVSYSLLDQMKD
jgi:hypothetical protein